MSTWTTAAGKACVSRVKFSRTHEWKRVDRRGRHITTERIIKKALHAISPANVKQDSALRDTPLSGESYPKMTYKLTDEAMEKLVEDYELVLQYLHRAYAHIPVARLRELLEYYREGEIIQYPESRSRQIPRHHHCDICLRTKLKRAPHTGKLDSGVLMGDHHACDL